MIRTYDVRKESIFNKKGKTKKKKNNKKKTFVK